MRCRPGHRPPGSTWGRAGRRSGAGSAGPQRTAARGFRWVVPPLPNFVHANLRPRAGRRRSADVPVRPAGEVRKPLAPVFICNSRICIWGPPQSDFPPFCLNYEGSVSITYFTLRKLFKLLRSALPVRCLMMQCAQD